MSDPVAWLNENGFRVVGSLSIEGSMLTYTATEHAGSEPSVYVVVYHPSPEQPAETWYVGSTHFGWRKRHENHNAAMRREFVKGPVKDVSQRRLDHLRSGGKAMVYERLSGRTEAFGRVTSSRYAEEAVVIDILQPKDNRLTKGQSVPLSR